MSTTVDTPATSSEDFGGPTASTLKQLASQLDHWRSLLPPELQWPEEDPTVFPRLADVPRPYNQSLDPSLATASRGQSGEPLFIPNLDQDAVLYPYAYDIQVALLRTRYYYAKYMVHRPFIYKALHFPDQMTPMDLQGVAECLKVRNQSNFPSDPNPTIQSLFRTLSPSHSPSSPLTSPHPVLPQVAPRPLAPLTLQTPNTLPLLLVAKLPRHPPHPTPIAARARPAPGPAASRQRIRDRCRNQHRSDD
jgi:hypothetical protein